MGEGGTDDTKEEKYNGWLISNSLIKRSFAVFGHYMLGYFMIVLTIMIPVSLIMIIGNVAK